MTANQKYLLSLLLQEDYYLVKSTNHNGSEQFKLYVRNQIPIRWIRLQTAKFLKDYFKKDKEGKITLNLSLIRQAHGNSNIKTFYKKYKNKQHGIRSNQPQEKIFI